MSDTQAIKDFYSKAFKFSYSSMNKLLFSPKLFYKDYILEDKEIRTDKHLIEGKLLHCLMFEPDNIENKFKILPEKTPSDNVRKVLHKLHDAVGSNQELLEDTTAWNDVILQALIDQNLYQSLKKDEARLAKIKTNDNELYWKFISNPNVDVVDLKTLDKCKDKLHLLLGNKDIQDIHISCNSKSDFDLDPVSVYREKYLECDLSEYKFGLKGFVDYYKIDEDNKTVTICDLKTTGKSISDFNETVDFYNYWLQAAIYSLLVYENHKDIVKDYKIIFKFIVIDVYNQVYSFNVSNETHNKWLENLSATLKIVDYHYTEQKYDLPFKFLINQVDL
jgi:hypothetical protein